MTEEVNPCFPPSLTCRSWPKERLVASRIILSTTKNKSASAGLCWDKWYDWFGVPEFALYLSVNNSSYFRNPKSCLSQGVFIFFPQKQAKSSLQNWHPECSRYNPEATRVVVLAAKLIILRHFSYKNHMVTWELKRQNLRWLRKRPGVFMLNYCSQTRSRMSDINKVKGSVQNTDKD